MAAAEAAAGCAGVATSGADPLGDAERSESVAKGINKVQPRLLVRPYDINAVTGNGLGLAWVTTVAKLYQRDLQFESSASGTKEILRFPFET